MMAVNKSDELKMEESACDFYELGLGEFYTLSA